jgi:hypothetical protein
MAHRERELRSGGAIVANSRAKSAPVCAERRQRRARFGDLQGARGTNYRQAALFGPFVGLQLKSLQSAKLLSLLSRPSEQSA